MFGSILMSNLLLFRLNINFPTLCVIPGYLLCPGLLPKMGPSFFVLETLYLYTSVKIQKIQ